MTSPTRVCQTCFPFLLCYTGKERELLSMQSDEPTASYLYTSIGYTACINMHVRTHINTCDSLSTTSTKRVSLHSVLCVQSGERNTLSLHYTMGSYSAYSLPQKCRDRERAYDGVSLVHYSFIYSMHTDFYLRIYNLAIS